jgi:hypothetical protein
MHMIGLKRQFLNKHVVMDHYDSMEDLSEDLKVTDDLEDEEKIEDYINCSNGQSLEDGLNDY